MSETSSVRAAGAPARRAVARWAWRLFRREWRQQLLVLVLVTLAVTAAVAGASLAVNAGSSPKSEFGDANAILQLDGSKPDAARAGVEAARKQFGKVDVITNAPVEVPGLTQRLDVRSQDPKGPYGQPMLALLDGRYPRTATEVALTNGAASTLSAHLGDTVELDQVARRVVGTVENPTQLDDEFALVAPSSTVAADNVSVLVVDPAIDRGPRTAIPALMSIRGLGNDTSARAVAALVLVATTLALALVGLIAASGFVVVAQRRQRQLGLLAAIGATPRQLRFVMVANGAIVGGLAAVVGAALGVLGWTMSSGWAEKVANHRIDAFALPWGLIVAIMLLALGMSIAAAWWPARITSRLSVIAALSGRPSRPLPVHRSLVLAVALVAGGVGAIAASQPTSTHVRPLVLIGGLVAVVLGVVFVSPAAIRILRVPARHVPFAARLALRDLARYQARAAAALAAITLGLGICVSVVGIAGANEYRSDEGNLSSRQVLIESHAHSAPDPDLNAAGRQKLDARAATVAAALGRDATLVPLDIAFNPTTAHMSGDSPPVEMGIPKDANTTQVLGLPYVATPSVLALFGIDPATIDPSTDLLTGRSGAVGLYDFSMRPSRNEPSTKVQRIDLPRYSSGPNSLITEAAMRRHGWVSARASWLVDSPRALTNAQISAARKAAVDAGLSIETRDSQDNLGALRTGATTAGVLLTIAIVMMAIGLLRGESAADLRTLTATGAAGRTRRALTATTAGVLALLGTVLGTAGAYAALVAGYHATLDKLVPVPLVDLLVLAIGLPLAATAAGWLVAGREPRAFARQALE